MVGLALILYEGGLQTSWRRLRAGRGAGGAPEHGRRRRQRSCSRASRPTSSSISPGWNRSFSAPWSRHRRGSGLRDAPLHAHPAHAGTTLEAESGGNDPMGIALTLGLIAWIERPDSTGSTTSCSSSSSRSGSGSSSASHSARRDLGLRAAPPSIGAFAPVASVAAGALSFGAADVIRGSGFLAVYLVGLAVGSTPSRYRRQLVAFHEGLAFLAQVAIFVVFGLLVFPSELRDVALPGLALALLLMLVIRPAAVWASTRFSASRTATGCCSAGQAFAARCRSSSRRSCSRRTCRTRTRSSTPCSSSSSSRRSSRARRSSGWPAGSACSPRRRRHTRRRSRSEQQSKLDLVDFVGRRRPRDRGLGRARARAAAERADRRRRRGGATRSRRAGARSLEPGDRLFVLVPHATPRGSRGRLLALAAARLAAADAGLEPHEPPRGVETVDETGAGLLTRLAVEREARCLPGASRA